MILRKLTKLAESTENDFDDVLVKSVKEISFLFYFVIALQGRFFRNEGRRRSRVDKLPGIFDCIAGHNDIVVFQKQTHVARGVAGQGNRLYRLGDILFPCQGPQAFFQQILTSIYFCMMVLRRRRELCLRREWGRNGKWGEVRSSPLIR